MDMSTPLRGSRDACPYQAMPRRSFLSPLFCDAIRIPSRWLPRTATPHGLSSGSDATLSDSATLYANLYPTICNHMMTLGQGHMRHVVVC
ncbi:hypothetical protein Focb16_v015942 [Fusarium oxysporum f. sp. cubense]|uniref:Uncharacterized protein n=1 Tax=Fusarium oxysporum f. sp. cubense TaxID=61366 RepID=A0A559KYL0_FUSOC|nr:hypothetical protein Focb16_v015942 [Fusarium oxysporum f. sp. cubense]